MHIADAYAHAPLPGEVRSHSPPRRAPFRCFRSSFIFSFLIFKAENPDVRSTSWHDRDDAGHAEIRGRRLHGDGVDEAGGVCWESTMVGGGHAAHSHHSTRVGNDRAVCDGERIRACRR